jgi:hypothetical protein
MRAREGTAWDQPLGTLVMRARRPVAAAAAVTAAAALALDLATAAAAGVRALYVLPVVLTAVLAGARSALGAAAAALALAALVSLIEAAWAGPVASLAFAAVLLLAALLAARFRFASARAWFFCLVILPIAVPALLVHALAGVVTSPAAPLASGVPPPYRAEMVMRLERAEACSPGPSMIEQLDTVAEPISQVVEQRVAEQEREQKRKRESEAERRSQLERSSLVIDPEPPPTGPADESPGPPQRNEREA